MQKFKVGDIVTRNDKRIPLGSPQKQLDDQFAGIGDAMARRMPARVLKIQEIDGLQSVYLDIPGFRTTSFNSLYLRIVDKVG